MSSGILVLNAGSSSIKFAIYGEQGDTLNEVAHGLIEDIGGAKPHFVAKARDGQKLGELHPAAEPLYDHARALTDLLAWLDEHPELPKLRAVGHRVVHGGTLYSAPVLLDHAIVDHLDNLIPLAPLHQPHNVAGIKAVYAIDPNMPQVACFDTAFHRSQPEVARLFAIPQKYRDEGVQRYGFHGMSYEFVASRLPDLIGERGHGKIVIAHLGNGASMCAIDQGKSVASTMGFTAVDGLPMGTRTGNIDPGVLLYMIGQHGMGLKQLTDLLYKQSGLLGLSGISNDMRTLLSSSEPAAQITVEYFCYRIVRELGSMAAALGGLDALVFTGGIGEHAAPVRARVCELAAWYGIALDPAANEAGATVITTADSRIPALVVPTDEEGIIARHTRRLASTV
ncbi:acetate/propionate family kinase [Plasticicumulans acidivorans]|uniref:Acetate kinase n=1 Tax=Plasticicumulans acidivorans TaxID=886464 RepID=A0A317MVV1_9GAMM|nr:acetate/propionate family kinase [Plasticicumulans acidivorans]PWV61864.1 acetate kinase [Plasticicumulans acidivorans]